MRNAGWLLLGLMAMGVAGAMEGGPGAIDRYLLGAEDAFAEAEKTRTVAAIRGVLPVRRPAEFASYARERLGGGAEREGFQQMLRMVESMRLNKLIGASSGIAGTTSLLSKSATPSVLGIGVEYGGVLQQTTGTVTTLRANALGLARLAFGAEQFPYCAEIAQAGCDPRSRWLRRFSGSIGFQHLNGSSATVGATPAAGTPPTVSQLFGDDYRMAAWGVRFDVTRSNHLDDAGFKKKWREAIVALRATPQAKRFTLAVSDLLQPAVADETYANWQESAVAALAKAEGAVGFRREMDAQLERLVDLLAAKDPALRRRAEEVERAKEGYLQVRDDLIREAQAHKVSVEYANQHPSGQPTTSHLRFIYSHQPSKSETVVTLNAAIGLYNREPVAGKGRLRDVQVAGQLDRRLGEVPRFGNAVATFAGYYQWMKEDSVILIGPGNVAPGSGIVLPGTAATLLGTKGSIGIVQAKLTLPAGQVVKIPFSVTWSNRTELIRERDLRAQVGVTFDLDGLFH